MVASLHSAFHSDPTERVCGAMENPHVDCIGHLTARRSAPRERRDRPRPRDRGRGADGNRARDQLSQPDRLDMPGPLARARRRRGSKTRARDERRAPGIDPRLRRARDRAGAAWHGSGRGTCSTRAPGHRSRRRSHEVRILGAHLGRLPRARPGRPRQGGGDARWDGFFVWGPPPVGTHPGKGLADTTVRS